MVPGYVDVEPSVYAEFTDRWVGAAAQALREGGHLAMVTGPEQTDIVMSAARRHGLTYVNRICARRPFALPTTRRFAHAHHEVSIVCRGPLASRLRHFSTPPDLPRARSGRTYPLDVWDLPKQERRGLLRYANALHPTLVRRLVLSLSRLGELVADPFLGSGTTLLVCLEEGRRFLGADLNPEALRFAMARHATEWLPPQQQLTLAV